MLSARPAGVNARSPAWIPVHAPAALEYPFGMPVGTALVPLSPFVEEFYRDVFDRLSDGVYFVTPTRQITFWNAAAERITGYQRQEVLGSSCSDGYSITWTKPAPTSASPDARWPPPWRMERGARRASSSITRAVTGSRSWFDRRPSGTPTRTSSGPSAPGERAASRTERAGAFESTASGRPGARCGVLRGCSGSEPRNRVRPARRRPRCPAACSALTFGYELDAHRSLDEGAARQGQCLARRRGRDRSWRVLDGMTCRVHAFEARSGGKFRISLTYDAPTGAGKTTAHTDAYHGRFAELVPNERVVELVEFERQIPRSAAR